MPVSMARRSRTTTALAPLMGTRPGSTVMSGRELVCNWSHFHEIISAKKRRTAREERPDGGSGGRKIRRHRCWNPRIEHRLPPRIEAQGDRARLGPRRGGCRQDGGGGRRFGNRLRGGQKQLLSAGYAGADGPFGRGVGERPQGLFLSSCRLYADQPRGHA